jgi:hypothetical protein
MPLTLKEIIRKEKEYFSSDLAFRPAIEPEEYYDDDSESLILDNTASKCVYLTNDGRKCAVGALIPDDKYSLDFDSGDGKGVIGLPEYIQDYLGKDNIIFLSRLQKCHDELARDISWEGEHFGFMFLERAKMVFPKEFISA